MVRWQHRLALCWRNTCVCVGIRKLVVGNNFYAAEQKKKISNTTIYWTHFKHLRPFNWNCTRTNHATQNCSRPKSDYLTHILLNANMNHSIQILTLSPIFTLLWNDQKGIRKWSLPENIKKPFVRIISNLYSFS